LAGLVGKKLKKSLQATLKSKAWLLSIKRSVNLLYPCVPDNISFSLDALKFIKLLNPFDKRIRYFFNGTQITVKKPYG